MAARRLASRIAAVREAVGLAAYAAEEWQTAIAELRTYHRMSGKQTHLAVLADCERALGRPERAIDLFRGADRTSLGHDEAIELLIVAAGARGDLGQHDAAVAMLQVRELTTGESEPWAARLRYAYADALLAAGRREEAREWFARAAEADEEGITNAAERLLELDGVVIEGDEDDDEDEDEETLADGDAAAGDDEPLAEADTEDDAAGEDAVSGDATGERAADEDPVGEDAVSGDSAGEDAVGEDAADEPTGADDTLDPDETRPDDLTATRIGAGDEDEKDLPYDDDFGDADGRRSGPA